MGKLIPSQLPVVKHLRLPFLFLSKSRRAEPTFGSCFPSASPQPLSSVLQSEQSSSVFAFPLSFCQGNGFVSRLTMMF